MRMLRKTESLYILILALLLFPLCAGTEDLYWICPNCLRGGNTGSTCSACGAARPESGLEEGLTQIPGETDRVMVNILRIEGSDYIKAKNDPYRYAPWKAADEDAATCWQFSAKNIQKKAWLTLIVEGQTIDEIWIRNGFQGFAQDGKDQYPLYARPKEIRVIFNDTDREASEEMTLVLTDEHAAEWEKLSTGRHENVYDVRIEVLSVYQGSAGSANACLSEIMLVRHAPASVAAPPME